VGQAFEAGTGFFLFVLSFNLGFVQNISAQKQMQEKKEPWQRKTFQGECPARVFENQQHNNTRFLKHD
jgi:hypothetical protein